MSLKFRLRAVTENGCGFTYSWGDTYEVEAADYAGAAADVLSREGTSGDLSYTRIVRAWVKGSRVHVPSWTELDPETGNPAGAAR